METDFKGFHEVPQFSTHSLRLSSDEVMKYQLRILESVKTEEIQWQDESVLNDAAMGKEDFQHIMSEWQSHLGSLQVTEPEDVDVPLDLLSSSDVLFDEKSPILSKALNCPDSKLGDIVHTDILDIKQEPAFEINSYSEIPCDELYNGGTKIQPTFDNELGQSVTKSERFECDPYQKIQSDQNYFSGNVKTEPTIVRKLTLFNGDKEILGKNIIGLHSLNEIKENPDQNCQVTSTVINGKRYKIIIKPKSQRLKKYNEEKIKRTLIKKLSKCNLIPKLEPKEDEIISEMRNGNYDVPILENDTLLDWDMNLFGNTLDNSSDNNISEFKAEESSVEIPKKVPPLKIKIPKPKKYKKKKGEIKSDEDVDVETIPERVEDNKAVTEEPLEANKKNFENENIKNSLPKEMVDRIESLKRRKDGRIPLVQVIPARKNVRSGTRMQDAAATINRNKLLKIVSGGDTVQLDHDYCSNTFKNFEASQKNTKSDQEVNLSEKNPKKDSGMESGDVSDASEDPQTPESINNLQSIQEINNKLLEQRRNGKTSGITKVAAAFFRAANVITSNGNVNSSDVVKTLVVSNGNKALTNDPPVASTNSLKSNGDKSDIVPSGSSEVCNSNDVVSKTEVDYEKKVSSTEAHLTQPERPKKKLKLEEYLSRRNGKTFESGKDASAIGEDKKSSVRASEVVKRSEEIPVLEKPEKKESKVDKNCDSRSDGGKGKKSRRCRSRRSSSTSSGERDERKNRERSSRSRSSWRGNRRDSWSRHKYRNSTSSDRRRCYWSRSLSRSSSRESSSSSDRSGGRRKRRISPVWYHRRSRSRSISRERSRSRNRGSNRRRQNHYFNQNFYSGRSRSPYRGYSVREKQRQIEERRVIYIGRIEEGMTNAKLRERFSVFGPIVDISLHFREYGDNYGFVTYAYKDDAYDAVEHGNDDPTLPRYDLCFGGRRGFCKERYADLDGMPTSYSGFKDTPISRSSEESFDLLLKEAQAKLKQRISKENKM